MRARDAATAFFRVASLLACLGVGCTFGVDVASLSRCAEAGTCPDALLDAGAVDAGAEVVAPPVDAAADGSRECPQGRGPSMIRVPVAPAFCIDETEVTIDQYAAFLATNERPDAKRLAMACRAHTDFTPHGAWPPAPGRGTSPVAFVDFCDAQAFCVWSGKALCGAREGGALDVGLLSRAAFDAWFAACGGDASDYPYGNMYNASTCNGADQGTSTTLPVASLSGCRAGASGAFDMSGNVWEWTDSCEQDIDLATDRCFARGGAFNAPSGELTCKARRASTRGDADATLGFRCCAP